MRNMILAVGPGTPASVVWSDSDDDDEMDLEESSSSIDDDDTDEASLLRDDQEENDNSESDHDDESDDDDADIRRRSRRLVVRNLLRGNHNNAPIHRQHDTNPRSWLPSLRHGGCINTACWLDTDWRVVSNTNNNTFATAVPLIDNKTPTQILTSGDDRLIKIWDVRTSMDTTAEVVGGGGAWDTLVPLCWRDDSKTTTKTHQAWKHVYNNNNSSNNRRVPGSVQLLATLVSGHSGNVFHICPGEAGKILTSGMDGYLRLSDLERETSSVVVDPLVHEEDDGYGLYARMAFSHQMFTPHTGLLCSERGLHRFDIRIPPREQSRTSLLQSPEDEGSDQGGATSCKICALWPPRQRHQNGFEATKVFAGRASQVVEMLDLRMEGSSKNVLQRYRPRCLSETSNVSVSGLDVSKDGRELLVSYENDQIYTFPIFPQSISRAGPSLEEVDSISNDFQSDPNKYVHELTCYGGHLNRFTFLKNARYAGPQDDYIVTGSDSGNAWVYERKHGTVVGLLGADSSTCNGVIPHPTLPLFITYGIDSTAKLWRAAPCVDPRTDDSRRARAKNFVTTPYKSNPVAEDYFGVASQLRKIKDCPLAMPDFVSSRAELSASGRFTARVTMPVAGPGSPQIGNSLLRLESTLRQNRFECYRGSDETLSMGPIEQPLDQVTHRVSLNRLRFQADCLGAEWNPLRPWAFAVAGVHPADLVPEYPSDWLLLDKEMNRSALDVRMHLNLEEYKDVLQRTFPEDASVYESQADGSYTVPWLVEQGNQSQADEAPSTPKRKDSLSFEEKARRVFAATVRLLKEGGNEAIKQGHLNGAARRYAKAAQYCAVIFMDYSLGNGELKHLKEGYVDVSNASKARTNWPPFWTEMLKIFVTSQLNLSLIMLKPEIQKHFLAGRHAQTVIDCLSSFTQERGKCLLTCDDSVVRNEEPSVFDEATKLYAKAFFRLGSAEMELRNYSDAVESFEASLSATKRINGTPDKLVTRRLQEAKRLRKCKKKRVSRKFQRLFQDETEGS